MNTVQQGLLYELAFRYKARVQLMLCRELVMDTYTKKGMLLVAALLEWEIRCASTKGLLKVICLASRGGGK